MRTAKLLISCLLFLSLAVSAPAAPVVVNYTWTVPTTGSPVVSYDVELSTNAGTGWTQYASVSTNSVNVTVLDLQTVIIRVRGKDALGRTGPWSASSDPWMNDPGPPGGCGKPTRTP